MATSYTVFKNTLRKSIIDSIYSEIVTKSARYYHWFGKENSWSDFLSPFIPSSTSDVPGPPQNNLRYDLHVRRDILTAKIINPSDVSYVVPRIDWNLGEVYDMYDDAYTAPIEEAINWSPGLQVFADNIIKHGLIYYRAINNGVLGTTSPTHVSGVETNGTVELAYLIREEFAYSGAHSLEESRFYVITSDFNVYKCIYNAENSPSTVEPTGTGTNIITTADGYKWKFMYNIPVSLRNKFLSDQWLPVTTALKSQFYSNGEITSVIIENPGTGYTEGDSIVVVGDGYIANNPYNILEVILVDGGEGYTVAPTITFSDPAVISGDEELATATATIDAGVVDSVSLITAGYGYDSSVTVTAEDPISFDSLWQPNTSVLLGNIIKVGVPVTIAESEYTQDIFYEVTGAGTTGVLPPTHTTGAELNGTAELTVVAKGAIIVPNISKTEAILTPIIEDGQITDVIIEDGGIGYTLVNIQVVSSTGEGAELIPDFTIGNIDSLQANVELFAVPGSIEEIKVVDGGTGYGTGTVTIIGDGTGATAQAIFSSGRLSRVVVTNPGIGYTWTDVKIEGNGTGAVARAIMSPIDGHGSNAINELNANSLMFYTTISRDKNQGIEINNDYRKVGLLKNPKQFGTGHRLTSEYGSGCVLITGAFDKNRLAHDMLLIKDEYKNYRIVDFTDTQILVSVFNNFPINIGDTLTTETGYSFLVTDVKERTIDQFSGELLMLSVREPFEPTDEQIVTVRSVITI